MFRGAMEPMPDAPVGSRRLRIQSAILASTDDCWVSLRVPARRSVPNRPLVRSLHSTPAAATTVASVRGLRLPVCPNGQEVRRIADPREIGVKTITPIVKKWSIGQRHG